MPPYRQQLPMDQAMTREAERGFTAVMPRMEASLLPESVLSDAVNVRLENGSAMTRPGSFPPVHHNATPYTGIAEACIYSDPQGAEWILVLDASGARLVADGRSPQSLPTGEDIVSATCALQMFSDVMLLRGYELDPLIWNGDFREPFVSVVPKAPDPERPSYVDSTPAAEFGIAAADRLWLVTGRDTIEWSDIYEPTRFDRTLNNVRLNNGSDDVITALALYQENRIIVFKEQSISYLANIRGDLSSLYADEISTLVGCVARKTVTEVGGDLFWLGEGGVYTLSQTSQSGLRTPPLPLSYPVQPWINRINWSYAHLSCATVDVANHLYLLAVPIDNSETPNAILVYNYATQAWQSMDRFGVLPPPTALKLPDRSVSVAISNPDTGPCFAVESNGPARWLPAAVRLLPADLFGRKSVFWIDLTSVIALGHGQNDERNGDRHPITTELVTRGYLLESLGIKQARAVTLNCALLEASLTLTVLNDGVNEEEILMRDKTRSRFEYSIHGRANWNPDNVADDFNAPYRQDYNWHAEDGCELRSGISLEKLQDFSEPQPLRRTGRWTAFRLRSTQGRVALRSVSLMGLGEKPGRSQN